MLAGDDKEMSKEESLPHSPFITPYEAFDALDILTWSA